MTQTANKINYAKRAIVWSIILAFFSAIVAIANPEIRCNLGLGCEKPQKEIELITQAETGDAIAGVMVKVIAKGAPEVQYTDSNGYTKVTISSAGDVHVNLSKSGYTSQDFFINLKNDQNTVRVIRFNKSGKPEISSGPTIIAALEGVKPASTVTPAQGVTTPTPDIAPSAIKAAYENDYIKASVLGASFDKQKYAQAGLVIESKTEKDLLLAYENGHVTAISNFGQASRCGLEGLVNIRGLPTTPNPLSFTTLKPKTALTVSVSRCGSITSESKANSINVNIPIVMLENDQYKKFTLNLNGIPLPK